MFINNGISTIKIGILQQRAYGNSWNKKPLIFKFDPFFSSRAKKHFPINLPYVNKTTFHFM